MEVMNKEDLTEWLIDNSTSENKVSLEFVNELVDNFYIVPKDL